MKALKIVFGVLCEYAAVTIGMFCIASVKIENFYWKPALLKSAVLSAIAISFLVLIIAGTRLICSAFEKKVENDPRLDMIGEVIDGEKFLHISGRDRNGSIQHYTVKGFTNSYGDVTNESKFVESLCFPQKKGGEVE